MIMEGIIRLRNKYRVAMTQRPAPADIIRKHR